MQMLLLIVAFVHFPLFECIDILHSCQDIYFYTSTHSGVYRIFNRDSEIHYVYCEFHGTYGYAFVSNLSHVDINIDDLYTNRSHVILRHLTSSGEQKEILIEQLSRYRTQPLSFFYNKHDGFAAPLNQVQLGPYLYLGFLPISIANNRNTQGYRAGGIDYTFQNCDSNPNSYLALFFNPKHADSVGYYRTQPVTPLMTYWITHSSPLDRSRYMLPNFYFTFEMHMGGCGGYEISSHLNGNQIVGAAIGFKFDIINFCARSSCLNGGTCIPDNGSFECKCKEGFEGEFCEIVADG